jgi:SAM-dependent methyltransferase
VIESWMLDEMAHAGPEHLDESFIGGYDRKQGYPDPDEDLAAFEAHGLGASSAVVDLGAGTGQFAIPAARRFGRVTAVDVSPAMIAALREMTAAAGLAAGSMAPTRASSQGIPQMRRSRRHGVGAFTKTFFIVKVFYEYAMNFLHQEKSLRDHGSVLRWFVPL